MSERARSEAKSLKHSNPDKGPRMIEGAHHFDKGYDSDDEVLQRKSDFPGQSERGNEYMKMRHEIDARDSAKLKKDKFSKIA